MAKTPAPSTALTFEKGKPLPPSLQEVLTLARRQVQLEELISDIEGNLKDLKEQHRALSEVDLPNAMEECGGLKTLILDTGEKVELKKDFAVGIASERREEAYTWLEQHNYGALIKTEVSVAFGKGGLETARRLQEALLKKKVPALLSRDVHWQSLKAFVTERMAEPIPKKKADRFPAELFGAVAVNRTKITVPKVKK